MKREYLVVIATDDGPKIYFLDKITLKERLEEKYWGDITWIDCSLRDGEVPLDLMSGANRGIIFKGKTVVPKEKAVAWEYDVE